MDNWAGGEGGGGRRWRPTAAETARWRQQRRLLEARPGRRPATGTSVRGRVSAAGIVSGVCRGRRGRGAWRRGGGFVSSAPLRSLAMACALRRPHDGDARCRHGGRGDVGGSQRGGGGDRRCASHVGRPGGGGRRAWWRGRCWRLEGGARPRGKPPFACPPAITGSAAPTTLRRSHRGGWCRSCGGGYSGGRDRSIRAAGRQWTPRRGVSPATRGRRRRTAAGTRRGDHAEMAENARVFSGGVAAEGGGGEGEVTAGGWRKGPPLRPPALQRGAAAAVRANGAGTSVAVALVHTAASGGSAAEVTVVVALAGDAAIGGSRWGEGGLCGGGDRDPHSRALSTAGATVASFVGGALAPRGAGWAAAKTAVGRSTTRRCLRGWRRRRRISGRSHASSSRLRRWWRSRMRSGGRGGAAVAVAGHACNQKVELCIQGGE